MTNEIRKKELTEQFNLNISRAYAKIKNIVIEETQDNQVLSQKYQAIVDEEKKNDTVIQKQESGEERQGIPNAEIKDDGRGGRKK